MNPSPSSAESGSRLGVVAEGLFALISDAVFTIAHGDVSSLYRVPRLQDKPDPSSLFLGDIWKTSWITNKVPFMALIPVHKPFYSPLFQRLNYRDSDLPLQHLPDGSWSLNLELICEWVSLERNLRAILSAMLNCSTVPVPFFFRLWSFPKRYGYELAYRTNRATRIIASRSRDAFVPLMVAISFSILVLDWEQAHRTNFNWCEKVLTETRIHHQWLTDLEMSPVGDVLIPRVGGFVDMDSCQFKFILPTLQSMNMPLFLHWGVTDYGPSHFPGYLEGWVLRRVEISRLQLMARLPRPTNETYPPSIEYNPLTHLSLLPPSSNILPSFATDSATPAAASPPRTFPPVEKYSGQQEGEDWQTFFARREKADVVRASHETPQDKQRRMQREDHAATGMTPGRKGARVFVWEEVDGFLVRRAAGRDHYHLIWEDFGPNQRKYNSFLNEWDLCEEFAPMDQPEHWDDDDDDDPIYNHPLLPQDDPAKPPDHNDGTYSSSADLRHIHDVPADSDDHVEFDDSLEDLAYYRFGFVKPLGEVNEPKKPVAWLLVQKLVGESWRTDGARPSKDIQKYLCNFFGHLLNSSPVPVIPQAIHDLLQPDADVHLNSNVCIRREMLGLPNQTVYYIVSSPRSTVKECPFQLALTSAASVVEIVRCQWGELVQIAHQLLGRGISFKACIRGDPRPPPTESVPRYPGLGYRPVGYKLRLS